MPTKQRSFRNSPVKLATPMSANGRLCSHTLALVWLPRSKTDKTTNYNLKKRVRAN